MGSRVESERLLLRDLAPGDEESLIPAWTDADVRRFMNDFGPRTADQVRAWVPEAIAATSGNDLPYGWAIELRSGGVIGWIGFGRSDRGVGEVDFAYALAPEHRGQSYGSEALRCVIRFCFDVVGVRSFWGECAVGNEASSRAMTKAGMTPIGVVGDQQRFLVELP